MNAVRALGIFGTVACFGGLLRIGGEALARLAPTGPFEGFDRATWISLGLTVVVFAVFSVVMVPWYRRFYRQHRADLAVTYGIPLRTCRHSGKASDEAPGFTRSSPSERQP